MTKVTDSLIAGTRAGDTGVPTAVVNDAGSSRPTLAERIGNWRYLGFSAFLFALLQTLCPAVIALSAVRVFIGLGALAAAAGTDAPPHGWHADWIRIPMMLLAAFGAALNLFIIWHVRRLRVRPAAQWRIAPLSPGKLRSERVQIVLAILTFVCLAAESIAHPMMHHHHQ
jgi:MFS family permease